MTITFDYILKFKINRIENLYQINLFVAIRIPVRFIKKKLIKQTHYSRW